MAASLPIAIAIALSPFGILPAVLVLFAPRPRPTGSAFVAGWYIGVTVGVTLGVLLSDILLVGADGGTLTAWVRVVVGVALAAVAARSWLKRHASTEPPKWMSSIRTAEPRGALKLGLVLSAANPKVLLLAFAGGGVIASEISAYDQQVIGVLAFSALASATVVAPLGFFVVLGDHALSSLEQAGSWLDRNSQALMSAVLLAIGGSLLISGIQTLAG